VCCSCLFIYWLEIFLPNLLLIVRKGDLWFCQALTEAKSYWLFWNETNSSACSQLTVSKYVNARKKTALVDILHLYSMISSKWTMWNNFFFWSRWFLNWSQMYCCQCRNPLGIACVILYCWASRTLKTKNCHILLDPCHQMIKNHDILCLFYEQNRKQLFTHIGNPLIFQSGDVLLGQCLCISGWCWYIHMTHAAPVHSVISSLQPVWSDRSHTPKQLWTQM